MGGPAADFWAAALGDWAIPQEILDAAPENPWSFPPPLFVWTPEGKPPGESDDGSPMPTSRRRALEALPEGGSVLDVGVGGGRASLALVPRAGLVVGVDSSEELLAAFTEAAERVGVDHQAVSGRWPDVAGQVGPADVVVCHHVAYNVANLAPFARALTDHARNRVVMELTATHPTSNLNPAWRALHGLERPTRPVADDAVAVLEEMGLRVHAEPNQRVVTPSGRDRAELVAFARRRLCVGPERDDEVDRLLGADLERPLRDVVAVWWDGQAQ